jgi:hypothetical protein
MRTHREFFEDMVGPMADIADAERAAILGDNACKLLRIAP